MKSRCYHTGKKVFAMAFSSKDLNPPEHTLSLMPRAQILSGMAAPLKSNWWCCIIYFLPQDRKHRGLSLNMYISRCNMQKWHTENIFHHSFKNFRGSYQLTAITEVALCCQDVMRIFLGSNCLDLLQNCQMCLKKGNAVHSPHYKVKWFFKNIINIQYRL